MTGQWTASNPGAGSPADIRAEASRRFTQAADTRTAAGHTSSAGSFTGGWQGAGATVIAEKASVYTTELEVLASQSESVGNALQRYSADVETIQHQTASVTTNQENVASRLLTARRRLAREHEILLVDAGASPAPSYLLQSSVDSLSVQANGLNAQMAALAQQRAAADNTAIMGLTSVESRGGLAGIVATTGGTSALSPSRLARAPSLEELAGLSELDLATLFALYPGLAGEISSRNSPDEVAEWWASLNAEQQGALILGAPALIGSLGGVAPLGRVAANRVNAVYRSELVAARLADLQNRTPSGGGSTPRSEDLPGEIATLRDEQRYLARILDGRVQVYLYDPDNGNIIEMVGTPRPSTTTMVTYVPGTYTSVRSFYNDDVQQVSRWLNSKDANVVAFVWKQGAFPGEDPESGSVDFLRIFEANDESRALHAGSALNSFEVEVHASSSPLAGAEQVGIGHSWGLTAITASEVKHAHYDQVHSLAGAGMPSGWHADPDTAYYHWSYTDAISMGQETGLVTYDKVPSDDPAFTSHIYHRDGDFDLYLPGTSAPGGYSTAQSVPVHSTTDLVTNHNLIATNEDGNQSALKQLQFAMETERDR